LRPAERRSDILAHYTDQEVQILGRITDSKEMSYASTNRMRTLERLIHEHKRQSIQRAIAAMKQEIQLAGTRAPEMIPELLQQVQTLHKVLSTLASTSSES